MCGDGGEYAVPSRKEERIGKVPCRKYRFVEQYLGIDNSNGIVRKHSLLSIIHNEGAADHSIAQRHPQKQIPSETNY